MECTVGKNTRMIKCPYCGRENADDAVQCRECGTRLIPEPPPAPRPKKPKIVIPFRARLRLWAITSFLVMGCLIHAAFLSVALTNDFWNDPFYHFWPGLFYHIWWVLLLIWPGWSMVLWKFGQKNHRVLIVVTPLVLGLIIMRPVLAMLLYGLAIRLGGLH